MTDKKPGRGSDQFPLRLPDGMRDRLKAEAETQKRSMNAEIVDRLERSFDDQWNAVLLRRRVEQLERAAEDAEGSITVKIPKNVQEAIAKTVRAFGSSPDDLLADIELMATSSRLELERLRQSADRQKVETDRVRNAAFGGRAVTAEADALRREREALDQARAAKAEEDAVRNARLDELIEAVAKLVEKSP